ncbi:hypothetical protein BDR22DRAFT_491009 [Usnea florida]
MIGRGRLRIITQEPILEPTSPSTAHSRHTKPKLLPHSSQTNHPSPSTHRQPRINLFPQKPPRCSRTRTYDKSPSTPRLLISLPKNPVPCPNPSMPGPNFTPQQRRYAETSS